MKMHSRDLSWIFFISTLILSFLFTPLGIQSQELSEEEENTPLMNTLDRLDISRIATEAFLKIPRRFFLPEDLRTFAEDNRPIPLSRGTIIPDYTSSAQLIEELSLNPPTRLLVYGRGCGFFGSLAATIVDLVHVVELEADLAEEYPQIWEDLGLSNISLVDDPFSSAEDEEEPAAYEAIFVHGSTTNVPAALFSLLAVRGRLAAPLSDGVGNQVLTVFSRTEDGFSVYTGEEIYFPQGAPLFED
ncbi:MAG: protein-L-isoaspartate O-methyltransferase family protein [Spirochaetaceae bacterium]